MEPKIRPLNESLQQIAVQELGEIPSLIYGDLENLKLWIKQQPHLKANTDDKFLLSFLRGCKYSLERTKSKIDRFFTMRSKFPEMFGVADIDDAKFREIFRLGMWLYLPTPLNENGPRIGLMRTSLYPADKYTMEEVLSVAIAMQEILLLEDDYATVNGFVFIGDYREATMAHLFQFTPTLMKKWLVYAEEAVPLRIKGSHFINTTSGMETLFNMVKPLLSHKQQNRLFAHGNKFESLYEHIPQKYLPKEYGGENGSIEDILNEWEKKFDKYRDYFIKSADYGTDEKLRPGKAIDFNSIFGIDGSFRKLDVD